jgi:polyvinyl alcohol dehydrogenase (cytochrome)
MQFKGHSLAVLLLGFALLGFASPALSQQPPAPQAPPAATGQAVYDRACASCHMGGSGAPTREVLSALTPEAIHNALVNGKMAVQGSTLTEAERRAVAEFLAARPLAEVTAPTATASRCTASAPVTDPASGAGWNGWGREPASTRFARDGGLAAADLPKLKLKWAFGYAGVQAARAQPTIAGGRMFVASENAEVHSLDPKTGCTHWTYKALGGVRTAPVVAAYKTAAGGSGFAVYFGDNRANAYAVDASTGREIWVRKVDDHTASAITGSLAVSGGRVFVPVQGLNEEGQGGRGGYQCCTFRGNLAALDANTGAPLWKTYMVDQPRPRAKTKDGVQTWGPAGGGIWSAPTVDTRRGWVYVATGNGYADPAQPMTDAVVAMDMETGRVRWVNQLTKADNWTLGCGPVNPDNPACPATLGPDYDFSASPSLAAVNGRDLLVLPQKSGMMYALDPDNEGAVVWQQRIGQGSGLGGQWGAAVDDEQVYVGVSDLLSQNPGGMRALRLADGQIAWSVGPQDRLCDASRPTCRASQGAAVTAIPGAVFSSSLDGGMRAYSTADGKIIWQFDTNREFETVNGVEANGGGMEGPGPIVSGGMLYFNSGYGGFIGNPGNVLLAFGIE